METFSIGSISNAVIIGGGHGIGFSLVQELLNRAPHCRIFSTFRQEDQASLLLALAESNPEVLVVEQVDPSNEEDMKSFFDKVAHNVEHLDLVLNCVGFLHDESRKPEKSLKDISIDKLVYSFTVNAAVTPLLAKVFLPLIRGKEISILASLSAKVGSIGDNRLGGWYGYRASKAALNMFIKNLSIEFSRQNNSCIALAIHPGTTETDLSKPYVGRSQLKTHSPSETAANILNILDGKVLSDSGKFFSWDGVELPW